jgi:hypothetical protein
LTTRRLAWAKESQKKLAYVAMLWQSVILTKYEEVSGCIKMRIVRCDPMRFAAKDLGMRAAKRCARRSGLYFRKKADRSIRVLQAGVHDWSE